MFSDVKFVLYPPLHISFWLRRECFALTRRHAQDGVIFLTDPRAPQLFVNNAAFLRALANRTVLPSRVFRQLDGNDAGRSRGRTQWPNSVVVHVALVLF